MCKEDVVKFSYSIAFAKDNYAKDHLEKSVELFCSIEKIDPPQRTDLYTALKEKIKYHFDDDKNKKRELITMITKALTDPDFDELTRREQEEIILKHKDEAIHDRDERIKEQENIISKQKLHLQQKDNIISNNKEIISQKEETISDLRKEIELLKNTP